MITPNQIRNAARFGTPITPDVLYQIAEELERLQGAELCGTPKKHDWKEPELVSESDTERTYIICCDRCGVNYFETEKVT